MGVAAWKRDRLEAAALEKVKTFRRERESGSDTIPGRLRTGFLGYSKCFRLVACTSMSVRL